MTKILKDLKILFKYPHLIKDESSYYSSAYQLRFFISEDKQVDLTFKPETSTLPWPSSYRMVTFNDTKNAVVLSMRESLFVFIKIQMAIRHKNITKINSKRDTFSSFINENVPDIETALSESWFSLMKKYLFWLTNKIKSILSFNKRKK